MLPNHLEPVCLGAYTKHNNYNTYCEEAGKEPIALNYPDDNAVTPMTPLGTCFVMAEVTHLTLGPCVAASESPGLGNVFIVDRSHKTRKEVINCGTAMANAL